MFSLDTSYSFKKYCYSQRNLVFPGYTSSKCSTCGRNIIKINLQEQKNEFIIDGGKQYPDFLHHCGAGMYFLISEKAMQLFKDNGITGFDQCEEVPVHRERSKTLNNEPRTYFSLSITGTIDFDLKAMTLKRKRYCPSCEQFEWNIQRLYTLKPVFDMNTWDKSDLCRIASFPGFIVCSEKLKNLIEEHALTGVRCLSKENIFQIV